MWFFHKLVSLKHDCIRPKNCIKRGISVRADVTLCYLSQINCRKYVYFNILAIFKKSSIVQFEAVALMVLKAVWQADVAQKSQQNSVKSVSFLLIWLRFFYIVFVSLWQECLNFTVCRFFSVEKWEWKFVKTDIVGMLH